MFVPCTISILICLWDRGRYSSNITSFTYLICI